MADAWHALETAEIPGRVEVDAATGLSPGEAQRRLERHGPNQLAERPGPSALSRFFAQFTDITVLALIVAALIAVVLALFETAEQSWLERFGDAIAIAIIVIINGVIGFVQERRAESALAALKDLTAPEATVLRDGKRCTLPARDLVRGDVVLLSEGDRIPADVRLIEVSDLRASEAALTGESAPVEKRAEPVPEDTPLAERCSMAYMGTHVTAGKARAIVTATGMETELGGIAGMLGEVEAPKTPLQRDLEAFGVRIVIVCVVVGLVVMGVGLLRGQASLSVLFLTAVSLAVAAIPEGLPAVTTIVLALGVQRMAARNALVRRLAAVETLGSATVICTDKTGTLTQNEMTVRELLAAGDAFRVTADGIEHRDGAAADPDSAALKQLLHACAFAPAAHIRPSDDGWAISGDPTDGALLVLHARFAGDANEPPVQRELPFDGERKLATVITEGDAGPVAITHGAAEAVFDRARAVLGADGEIPFDDQQRAALREQMEAWSDEGLRILALAQRQLDPESASAPGDAVERELTLLGLVAISDPPRPEVPPAVERARSAGVRTVMITGDHPRTARAIAREVGIDADEDAVLPGSELDALSDDELSQRVDRLRVIARATAANKLRIVRALQDERHVVAMTGDGVNDAPALKAATIGVAMGRGGTDVTREAADLVLADDNYSTIVAAIEEGRIIFSNIRKFIVFLLSVNAGLVLAVFVAALLGWPPILTPTQILWINLITNGLPALALGMEPVNPDPMQFAPRSPDAGLLRAADGAWIAGHGAWMAVLGLAAFYWQVPDATAAGEQQLAVGRTLAFTVLAVGPLFHALNCRSARLSLFQLGVFSNWRLIGSFGAALGLQSLAIYIPTLDRVFGTAPLNARLVGVGCALSATVLIVGELEKVVRRALDGQRRAAKMSRA